MRMPFGLKTLLLQRVSQSCAINQYEDCLDSNLIHFSQKDSDTIFKNHLKQKFKLIVEDTEISLYADTIYAIFGSHLNH